MSKLEKAFASACRHVSSGVIDITPLQQVQLYALYKQATVGPCVVPTEPLPQSSGEEAKGNAWSALGDMTRDCACQLYIDTVSSIDTDWEVDTCSSSSDNVNTEKHTRILDHISVTKDSALPARILSLLCRCFPGSFDDDTSGDDAQKCWLFSIYAPADCAFAVVSDGTGRVIGFAAAALFSATRRMNLFNLVTRPYASDAQYFVVPYTHLLFLQCVDPCCRRIGIAKDLAGNAPPSHLMQPAHCPAITLHPLLHSMTASLASHALHLGLEEVRGRSDASNKTLSDIYHGVGCKRIRTGLSSTSNIESVQVDTSSDFIEWAIGTSELIHALARPPPPYYRVRRVSAPLPPFNFVRYLPQHPSSAHPESLPSASLSQAASAAFVRGDVNSAKLLWQQLLQTQPPPERVERLEALQALAVLGESQMQGDTPAAATDVAGLALQAAASGLVGHWQRACAACPRDGLLWLRLALAYQSEGIERSGCGVITNRMRACAVASIACRCLTASIAHYSCFTSRTASCSVGSGEPPLGGSLPVALAAARSILVQNLPQWQAGEPYVLPSGAGATAFEQQWLCGGAAAEAALQKEDDFVDARSA